MIKLIKGFVVDVDPLNYTLKKETGNVDKEGNKTYRTYGYHRTLKHAIATCVDVLTKEKLDSDVFELKEAIEIINQSQEVFRNLLNDSIKEVGHEEL